MTADEKFCKELDEMLALDAQPHVAALRRIMSNLYNPAAAQRQQAYERFGADQFPAPRRPPPGRHQTPFTRVWQFIQALEEGDLQPRQ